MYLKKQSQFARIASMELEKTKPICSYCVMRIASMELEKTKPIAGLWPEILSSKSLLSR